MEFDISNSQIIGHKQLLILKKITHRPKQSYQVNTKATGQQQMPQIDLYLVWRNL